jgi:uncharacterized protein (TIGR03083 family)
VSLRMKKTEQLRLLEPFLTAHLLPALEGQLLELLAALSPDDWEKQTVSPKWRVRDVAAHLLDTQLRKLSFCRDRFAPQSRVLRSRADLVALIDSLNEKGVSVYRGLSPRVLISLMELASRESAIYHMSLDPMAKALFPVSWAGETESANWFDTARELTERWHHQQQIRLATHNDRPGIMTRDFYYPVLDCFMRALPFHYRNISRPQGTLAHFHVSGDCGGSWYLYRDGGTWVLTSDPIGDQASRTVIPQEIAWRIFTKGIAAEAAMAQVEAAGDAHLGLHILTMVSIVG